MTSSLGTRHTRDGARDASDFEEHVDHPVRDIAPYIFSRSATRGEKLSFKAVFLRRTCTPAFADAKLRAQHAREKTRIESGSRRGETRRVKSAAAFSWALPGAAPTTQLPVPDINANDTYAYAVRVAAAQCLRGKRPLECVVATTPRSRALCILDTGLEYTESSGLYRARLSTPGYAILSKLIYQVFCAIFLLIEHRPPLGGRRSEAPKARSNVK